MRNTACSASRAIIILFLASGIALAQVQHQSRDVVVNGHSGQASVILDNGRAYVDLGALAQIGNGSVNFSGNQIVLTLPPSTGGTPASAELAEPPQQSGLSTNFMKAGIEEIARIREWASPMANAIKNGYPIQEQWVSDYQAQAANGLRLASVAATTDDDKNALQLLTNEFNGVTEWSDRLLKAQKNMDTAKYSMSPNKLRDEPLSQKLITCYHFLSSMLGSGSFQDDSSCH